MKKIYLVLFGFASLFGAYQEIDALCSKFNREFTIFNIGANNGEFAFDISQRFKNAKVVMVEDNNPNARSLADALIEKCSLSKKENIPILINKRLEFSDYTTLSSCCYFDVVTVIGESAYTGKQYYLLNLELYAENILSLGFHTFVELETNSELYKAFLEFKPSETFEKGNKTLFHFVNEKNVLTRAHFFAEEKKRDIVVDFDRNIEIFKGDTPFKTLILQRPAGLSLLDFKALYGAFPTVLHLVKFQNNFKYSLNLGLYPHEIYVQANGFKLASPYFPIENNKSCDQDFIKAIIHGTTKTEVEALLKD